MFHLQNVEVTIIQWWGYLNTYCWTVRNSVFADVKEEFICAQTPASAEVIYLSFHKPLENPFPFVAQKSLRLKNRWSNTLWFRTKVCCTAIHTTKWVIFIFFFYKGMACKHVFPCSLSPLYECCTFPAAFSSIAYTDHNWSFQGTGKILNPPPKTNS